jgi:hypothetical protein
MLRSLRDLTHYKAHASDGDIGHVVKFLIDDERWAVRYLVVQAGGRLFMDGRLVLISPISFGRADWQTRRFHVALTMDKVKNGPSIDVDKPVSRQQEERYNRYYDFPYYWGYPGTWGMGAYPSMLAGGNHATDVHAEDSPASSDDVHLRSDKEVRGYHVEGTDGAIGHIEDFIVDDDTWQVRYLVVDTRNWWFGKKVLVAPQWANHISWRENKVYVDLSRQAIKDSPEWNEAARIDRAYETRLHDHYKRPAYWAGGPKPAAGSPPPPESRAGR